jgi:hypothetical protein
MTTKLTTEQLLKYFTRVNSYEEDKKEHDKKEYEEDKKEEFDDEMEDEMEDEIIVEKKHLDNYEEGDISNFTESFIEIFDREFENITRRGVIREYINSKTKTIIKLDLVASFLTVFDDEFRVIRPDEQIKYIIEFNNHIINVIKTQNLFQKMGYKDLGWTRKDIENDISNGINSTYVIKILADYFNCNLFIMDLDKEEIYAVYSETKMNRFKPNLIFSYSDEKYEPLFIHDSGIWNYNNGSFENLLSSYHTSIKALFKNEFEMGTENPIILLEQLTSNEQKHKLLLTEKLEEESDVCYNEESIVNQETKDLTSMKLDELLEYAKSLDIDCKIGETLTGKPKYLTKAKIIKKIEEHDK